jgi:hypothetical protein
LSGNTIFGTPTVEETVYTAVTATATQTGRTATRFVSWVISVSDLFFKYNTLLIPGASTTFVDDASTNNFAVTINGDTKPNSFNPYTAGYYSNFFDGTGDYLSVPSSANLAFGTGDFCVEMWYYQTASAGVALFSNSTSSGGGDAQFEIQLDPVNLYPRLVGWASIFLASSVTSSINRWNHLVVNRSGTTASMFLNGTRVATATVSNNFSSTNAFNIGRQASNSGYLTGYISNLRAVKGSSVYDPTQSTITVPTSPLTAIVNTSLLTCQSNRFIDNSTNALTITVNGNTSISSFDPFVPNSSYSTYGSGYFDGTGDYLTWSGTTVGTGAMTFECWFYYTGSFSGISSFIGPGSAITGGLNCYINDSTSFAFDAYGVIAKYFTVPTITANTWNHVAFVRNSSNLATVFFNGVRSSTGTVSDTYSYTTSAAIGYTGGVVPRNWIGYITNARLVVGSNVYDPTSTTITVPTTPLTAVANTQLLTLQNNQPVNNNRFLDNSTNNFLIDRYGNATQGTFSPYGGNWSNYFDGTGDYLTVGANANLSVGTSDFTIEAWVNLASGSTYQFLMGSSANGGMMVGISVPLGTPSSTIAVGTHNVAWVLNFGGAIPIVSNAWTHIAITRSGSTNRAFVDGVQLGSNITDSTNWAFTNNAPYIALNAASNNFNGYISNLRVVKGTAVYTSAFTPPTTPLTPIANTALLTCADNRLIDDSVNNLTITRSGDTSVQRFSPFNPSSVTPTSYSGYFGGTGNGLLSAAASNNLVSTDFTWETWVNFSSLASSVCIIASGNSINRTLFYYDSTNGLRYAVARSGADQVSIQQGSTTGWAVNTWYHVVIVRSGNNYTLYRNGVSIGTGTSSYSQSDLGTGLSVAYSEWADSHLNLTGFISNARVVNGTAVYTSAFTPPTSPLTAISGTKLLTCQSPTFIDNSTNNFTITAFGNSQPTQQNPFGFTSATTEGYTVSTIGGSGYFDGTGDYLTVPSNTAFYLATGNFTIEAWIYKRTSGKQIIVGQSQNTGSPYAGWTLYVDNSSLIVFEGTNGALIGSPTVTVPLNAWTHIAIVKSSSTVTIYQNGVSVNSGGAPAITNFNTVLAIGNFSSYVSGADWNGYISDLRIVKGTAIYSSNFVPPAAPILSVQNTSLLTNMTSAGIYDASMITTMESGGDAKLSTAVSKFGGSSMYFDGTGDYMVASGTTATGTSAFGSGDFTIEFWLYANSVAATDQGLIDMRPTSTNGYYPYLYMYNGQVTYWLNATAVINSSAGAITTGTWYHIALARSGSSNKLFINGVQSGSTFTSSTALLCDSNRPAIGSSGTTLGGSPLNGYIDDLRITKGYARYTTNFTPPTAAFKIK